MDVRASHGHDPTVMMMRDDPRLLHTETLIDAIDLPIGRWDAESRLVFCNEPYLAWTGRPRAALLGKTLAELYGDEAWATAREAFATAFGGHAATYDRRMTHRSPPRWTRVHVFPDRLPGGHVHAVYTLGYDIDDDVTHREAIESARRRLDRFTENIPYPLTYVDRDFVLRFVNRAYVDATGVPAAQLVGRAIGEVRGARRWAEHRPWFERALAGEAVQYTRLTEINGQGPRWMRTSYVPDRNDRGEVVGLYTVSIDVHELTLAQERLKRSVEHDALTDALSRRTMMDRISEAAAMASGVTTALYFVDLDGLKGVNDTHGHTEGDRVLCAVAQALKSALRQEDAVGRFGGDEFLVLAAVHDRAGAQTLAQHLLNAVRASGHDVTASIGYAIAPLDCTEPLQLIRLADAAMYAAKREGKNRVRAA